MISPAKLIRYLFHSLTFTTVTLLVLAAVFLSAARLAVPVIENYKTEIENRASDIIGHRVKIATLDAGWYGLEPQLVLKGVRLLSEDGTESFGYFQQARIGLNVMGSFLEWRLKPSAFTIEGASLSIVRELDGKISISGLKKGAVKKQGLKKQASKNQVISDWLFNQRLLDIKDTELHWLDLQNDEAGWQFSNVNLRFRNDGDHHVINGSVLLPEELGARLEVAVDVKGDLLSANGWSGSAYVEGANLQLARWFEKMSSSTVVVSNAMLGLRLWSKWENAKLISLQGEAYSNGVQLSAEDKSNIQLLESFSSYFSIQKKGSAWEAVFSDVAISTAETVWPSVRVDVSFEPKKDAVDARVSYVNIYDILPAVTLFLPVDSKLVELLLKLKPAGALRNLTFSLGERNENAERPAIYVSGEFYPLTQSPWKRIPGFRGAKGRFEFNNNHFFIGLPSQNFHLNYAGVFSYPLDVEGVSANVYGRHGSDGLALTASIASATILGATTNGSLKLELSKESGPLLDLAFYFKNGQVENAKYYIPAKIMKPAAVDWITRSLIDGDVESGGLLYYGNLKEFPFNKNEGLFDLDLKVSKGKLIFAKGWPEITAIDGDFSLFARGLRFYAHTGRTLKNKLQRVDVVFPEFWVKERKLIINGNVVGDSENKINYMHESPLENIFAKNIAPLKMTGESELKLDLEIPLANPKKTKVKGVVSVRDNHLMAKEWKLDIEKVFLDLRFDNRGIYTDKLTGLMEGVPLEGRIDTVDEGEVARRIVIEGGATVDEKQVGKLLGNFIDKAHWARYMTGRAVIKTGLSIPIFTPEKDGFKKITLSLDANLSDVSLSLPYPLSKKMGKSDEFSLVAELSGEKRYLNLKTNKLTALLEMMPVGDTQSITRGGIGFEQQAELPTENGYRFIGHLDRFSWTEWEPVIFPAEDEIPLLASGGAGGSQYFDVDVNKLEIFGLWFGKTAIQASSSSQLWSIHLSGDEVAGEIFIPVVLSSAPLVMNMDKLIIELPEGTGNEKSGYLDPRLLPDIKVTSKLFILDKRNYGALRAVASGVKDGLRLDQFSLKTKYTDISATGHWLEADGKQTSKFDILVKTSHLGKTIKSWNFEDAFGGGTGDIRVNAYWLGKPTDFSFKTVAGTMGVDIEDTSLLDFELGAAKMAGLFLPRRLLLDFRDVFKKGMHFDSLKGQYQIENGNAFTTNLRLDGPAADILMAGRIGLIAEDYDQLVTVNRRLVGDSISTLAALAANPLVNPLLAAQVYALKKLFEKQIDDMLTVQYTITGSWEDPKMTPVVKNLKDRGENIDELFE